MNGMELRRQQPEFIAVFIVNAITIAEGKQACVDSTDAHTEYLQVMFFIMIYMTFPTKTNKTD